MSRRYWWTVGLGWIPALASAQVFGCSSEPTTPGGSPSGLGEGTEALACAPQSARACPCLGGGTGTQLCLENGQGYAACQGCKEPESTNSSGVQKPDASTSPTGTIEDARDGGGLDAGAGDGASSEGGPPDAGEGPVVERSAPGPSCGVGLPAACDPGRQKCCVRSLSTDSCIDAEAACTCEGSGCTAMEVRCDGPEDCEGGQVCCGTLNGGSSYTRFECASDCDYAGTQRIACHNDGPACPGNNICAHSQLLTNIQVCIDPATIQQ